MGKGNRPDFIEEVNEHAQHNSNPYYWLNRVNSFTIAGLRASLAASVIECAIISLGLIFTIIVMFIEHSFSDYAAIFWLLFIFWLLTFARAIRWFKIKRQNKPNFETTPKAHKKKLSKHRKDYGRN
jgi:uncharacterized membrane protein YbhN (UPF0104 family)